MLDDDLLNDGQSQAGAIGFGGVERHEYLGQSVGRNSRSIVGNGNSLSLHGAGLFNLATDNDASAAGIIRRGLGGVSRKIQDGLAKQGVVAGNVAEFSFAGNWHIRHDVRYFSQNPVDQWPQSYPLIGEIQRARKFK